LTGVATIDEVIADIAVSSSPVLCLDTCDFMDVVRGVAEENLFHAQSFRLMRNALASGSLEFQIVITYLVRHEWEQNKAAAVGMVQNFLKDLAKKTNRVTEVRQLSGLASPAVDQGLFDSFLGQTLIDLAESIMTSAVVLKKHEPCVDRALDRVMDRKRPSHQREIKDSINWEHYLELAARLKSSGYAQPLIFVSANKKDFWANEEGKGREKPTIHLDLKAEADAVGLQFFGRLDLALRTLGI